MRKSLFAGLLPLPPLSPPLRLTLAALVAGALNLAFLAEVWPHTPTAKAVLLTLEWLLVLALLPQGVGWGWRWLRAYAGPGWLRLLATAAFLGAAGLVLGLWLAVLVGGPLLFYRGELL